MSKTSHSSMPLTFAFGATDTVIKQRLEVNGFIKAISIKTPNFTNSVTATVTIDDPLNSIPSFGPINLFTKSGIASNTNSPIVGDDITAADTGEVPADFPYTATVTLSGAPGGTGGVVLLALYLKH
jgi:hypothetical protein